VRSDKYWPERFLQLENALHEKGLDYLQTLDREYKRSLRNIEADISKWYTRFADNNEISIADARRWLNKKELKEFRWTVQEYVAKGEENALTGEWMKQLENASARVHISRLESLRLQIQQEVEALYGGRIDDVDGFMREIYSQSYYHRAFEIQRGVGIGWSLHSIEPRRLDTIISKPWAADGLNFSERIWRDKTKLINNLQSEITQSLMLGTSPQKVIDSIAAKLNTSRNNAGRLVMTEQAYFSAVAAKDTYKELDIEYYRILATLDNLTSDICQEMDGKVFPIGEFEPGVTANPFHPNCRTDTAPEVEDDYGERIARGADGQTYYVPGDMTYKEWFEKYVESDPREYAAYKGARAGKQSEVQFEKYKAIYGQEFPKKLEDFHDLKYNRPEEWELFKSGKQSKINSLDYSNDLDELLGNFEVRSWYKAHDSAIPEMIDTTKPLGDQAMQAHELRNTYRTQARYMMADVETVEILERTAPNQSFADILEHKELKYGLTGEDAYRDIIRSAQTTRRTVDKKYGLDKE